MVELENDSQVHTPTSVTSKRTLMLGIGLILIGVIIAISFVIFLWRIMTRIDPSVAAAIITASGTVLVATVTVVAGRIFERKKMIAAEQRAKWAVLYEEFIRGWLQMMGLDQPSATRQLPPESTIIKFFADFSAKAIPWASPEVIRQWSRWKSIGLQLSEKSIPTQSTNLIFETEKLILAMRKDLGHKDGILDDHQILRMFITDLDAPTSAKD